MRWIGRMFVIIFATALLLAIFSPGSVATSAILIGEKVTIVWCVINFFAIVLTGKDIPEHVSGE